MNTADHPPAPAESETGRSGAEHVVPADAAVVRLRRLLLHCADAREKGADAVGVHVDLGAVRANTDDISAGDARQHVVLCSVRVETR